MTIQNASKAWASVILAGSLIACAGPATSQETTLPDKPREIVLRQVAPDLYFLFDYASSNASFLVTEEGVLVVDTRQHVRDGEDLLRRIRAITDKPIRWVVNTHFHADHYLGNPAFKAA